MKIEEDNSMQVKPWWWEAVFSKNLRWSRPLMDKDVILNPSLWLDIMTSYFNRKRITEATSELRRRWNLDVLATTNSNNCDKINGILRVEIPHKSATLGLPDCCKVKGDGDSIVAYQNKDTLRRNFKEGEVNQQNQDNRENLYLNTGPPDDTKFRDIYRKICETNTLIIAYYEISKGKGANTKGIDAETLDGYSMEEIIELKKTLKNHSFKFKPVRRIYIPKANGELRPLGIPSPRDKVVQKAAQLVLSDHYEKIFLKYSHGFRLNKGTHTALKEITKWQSVKWFIEGDISKYFDTINHQRLAEILKENIEDRQFIDFYWKAVKVSYVNVLTKEVQHSEVGTLQGGTLSPILANIYLHKLDKFMDAKIKTSRNSGKTYIENPKYKKIHTQISNLRQPLSKNYRYNRKDNFNERKRLEQILLLEKERSKLNSTKQGPGSRIYYVRYANDFLVGVNGTYKNACELKKNIEDFLHTELKLQLNNEKTKITSSTKDRALFLGANIRISSCRIHDQKRRKDSFTSIGRKIRARQPLGKILLLAPIERIVRRLESQGICKVRNFRKRDVIPTRKTAWVNLDLEQIINKYNDLWRGILQYYSFAYNRCQLNLVQYLIQHSAACTIMNKMKLNSRAQVFKRYGFYLNVGEVKGKQICLKLEKSLKRLNKFSVSPTLPYAIFNWNLRTKSILDQPCSICKSTEQVEMHHRRGLKQGKTNTSM